LEQPFGFTQEDVAAVRRALERGGGEDKSAVAMLRPLVDRIEALLPPA
jgi:hypothetical protein